jgi:hypothetical protein
MPEEKPLSIGQLVISIRRPPGILVMSFDSECLQNLRIESCVRISVSAADVFLKLLVLVGGGNDGIHEFEVEALEVSVDWIDWVAICIFMMVIRVNELLCNFHVSKSVHKVKFLKTQSVSAEDGGVEEISNGPFSALAWCQYYLAYFCRMRGE